MEFTVKVEDGNVYINGEFVNQLCWDANSIGSAIADWIEEKEVGMKPMSEDEEFVVTERGEGYKRGYIAKKSKIDIL